MPAKFVLALVAAISAWPTAEMSAQDWLPMSPVFGTSAYRLGRDADSVFRSIGDRIGRVAIVEVRGATLGVTISRLDAYIAVRILVWNPADTTVEFDSDVPLLFDQDHVALRRVAPDVVANSYFRKVHGAPRLPPKIVVRSQGQATVQSSRFGPTTVNSRSTTTVEEDSWTQFANALGAMKDRRLLGRAERAYRDGLVGSLFIEPQSAAKGAIYFERPDHDDRLQLRLRGLNVEIPFIH